ncbi:hypothetical protein BH18ACT4_BH18ACT4_12120 [soil metagenome]
MAVVAYITNKPDSSGRERYEAAFHRIDELDVRHPEGRLIHVSWITDGQMRVLDVWQSEQASKAFYTMLAPILSEFGMELSGPPELGELVQVITGP